MALYRVTVKKKMVILERVWNNLEDSDNDFLVFRVMDGELLELKETSMPRVIKSN